MCTEKADPRIPPGEVADIRVESGPAMIKSENARSNGRTFVDIKGGDLRSCVAEAQCMLDRDEYRDTERSLHS